VKVVLQQFIKQQLIEPTLHQMTSSQSNQLFIQ